MLRFIGHIATAAYIFSSACVYQFYSFQLLYTPNIVIYAS